MIAAIFAYVLANKASVVLTVGVIYGIVAGSQPPLSPEAGYFKTWAYRIFQTGAANFHLQQRVVADPSTTTKSLTQASANEPSTVVIKGK